MRRLVEENPRLAIWFSAMDLVVVLCVPRRRSRSDNAHRCRYRDLSQPGPLTRGRHSAGSGETPSRPRDGRDERLRMAVGRVPLTPERRAALRAERRRLIEQLIARLNDPRRAGISHADFMKLSDGGRIRVPESAGVLTASAACLCRPTTSSMSTSLAQ